MPLRHRRERRLAITLTAAGALVATAALPAAGRPPVGPFFDCFAATRLGLIQIESTQLKSSTVYLSGSREGRHFSGKPIRGRYRAQGNLITWQGGSFAGFRGVYIPRSGKRRARINIVRKDGSSFGVSCEQV